MGFSGSRVLEELAQLLLMSCLPPPVPLLSLWRLVQGKSCFNKPLCSAFTAFFGHGPFVSISAVLVCYMHTQGMEANSPNWVAVWHL